MIIVDDMLLFSCYEILGNISIVSFFFSSSRKYNILIKIFIVL